MRDELKSVLEGYSELQQRASALEARNSMLCAMHKSTASELRSIEIQLDVINGERAAALRRWMEGGDDVDLTSTKRISDLRAKRSNLHEKADLLAQEIELVRRQLHGGPGRSASMEVHDARQRLMLELLRAECDAAPQLRQTLWRLYSLLRSSHRAWPMRDWNHMMDVLGIAFPDDSAATELAATIEAQYAGHLTEEPVA
jgi:chromosome segregation ATPase